MTGAQAAQACTEPALGDLPARAQAKKLVRFELSGLTPGSEYLLKVNGHERKSGVATADKVSRRFRMPSLGNENRRVQVDVVVANDGCENSPWKLEEKMTYRPAPEPQPPAAQPKSTPAPAPDPSPSPSPSPSPPPAPDPPSPPSVDSTPGPQPAIPAPKVKPATPVTPTPTPTVTTPPRDAKAWITPLDPSQRGESPPFKLNEASLARTDQPSEVANSTAALIGLGGVFLLMIGTSAVAWNRFRRYDNERLHEVENPDGKLPTHLDREAGDMQEELGKKRRGLVPLLLPWRKRRAPEAPQPVLADLSEEEKAKWSLAELEQQRKRRTVRRRFARRKHEVPASDAIAPAVAAAATEASAAGPPAGEAAEKPAEKRRLLPWAKRQKPEPPAKGILADLSEEEKAKMSEEELEQLREERRRKRKLEKLRKFRAPLPTYDPTAPGAEAAAKEANGKPPASVPPIPTPHGNGTGQPNGTPRTDSASAAKPAAGPVQPPNGQPAAKQSYRQEVESELQRILDDAGLHAEVDGILTDAKKEAARQGVPIDSELMLKALCDETNGAAKLSESAKEELESRFKRIVAEERSEPRPSPDS